MLIEHIEAEKSLINIEINAIDDAILSITTVKSFADISDVDIIEALQRVRNTRIQRIQNLDERLADLDRGAVRSRETGS
jgi:uncharacterized protein with ACT and thioredoxin-like domain